MMDTDLPVFRPRTYTLGGGPLRAARVLELPRDDDSLAPDAVAMLLLLGFVPRPLTVFKAVRSPSAYVSPDTHRLGTYLPFRAEPQERRPATTRELLDWLARAVEATVPSGSVLLLSSGKDSSALALACAHAGKRIECVTYSGEGKDDEWAAASALCRRLGFRHRRLALESLKLGPAQYAYYERVPEPNLDQAQLSYLWLADAVDGAPAIVDGMGNDFYFGHIPSKQQHSAAAVSLSRFLPALERLSFSRPAIALAKGVPFRSIASAHGLFNDVPLAWLRGSSLFPDKSILEALDWLSDINRVTRSHAPEARRALTRGFYVDSYSFMGKTENLAVATGSRAVFPWTEARLQREVIRLPAGQRFDWRNRVNKLLLRQLLQEKLGAVPAKLGYTFPAKRFLLENEAALAPRVAARFRRVKPRHFRDLAHANPRALQSLVQFSLWQDARAH